MGKAGAEHGVIGGERVAGHPGLHPREGGGCHGVGGRKAGNSGMPGGVVRVDGRLGVHLDGGHGAVGRGLHLHRPRPLAHHHLGAAVGEKALVQVQGYCSVALWSPRWAHSDCRCYPGSPQHPTPRASIGRCGTAACASSSPGKVTSSGQLASSQRVCQCPGHLTSACARIGLSLFGLLFHWPEPALEAKVSMAQLLSTAES